MIVVYSVALGLGLAVLVGWILVGGFAAGRNDERRRRSLDTPGLKMIIGGVLGFGMGGVGAEFAPIDFAWPVILLIASGAAVASVLWVRYATKTVDG
jgi:hypothetical protein